ncbi:MAG: SDR family oxidoreductase [Bacteroidota bacterium]
MKQFTDKIVVITGAGSGIGRALALEFGKLGAKLALNDYEQAGLEETLALLSAIGQQEVLFSVFDVSVKEDMLAFAEKVQTTWGNAHVIINNAGIPGAAEPGYLIEESTYRRVMDINFFGVLNGCQSFLPQLVANNEGAVVNISSVFGLIGTPSNTDYCASKFAVRGYTEALAVEFQASPISIHCVHPGGIKTNIAKGVNSEFDEQFLKTDPHDLARFIIKGIQRQQPRLVYGFGSRKARFGATFLPQKMLHRSLWKLLQKTIDMANYRTFLKGIIK